MPPPLIARLLHLQLDNHQNHEAKPPPDPVSDETSSDTASEVAAAGRGDVQVLYEDAAGYAKALKNTGCLQHSTWTSNGDSGFNHLVAKDMSTEEKAWAQQERRHPHPPLSHFHGQANPIDPPSEEALPRISPPEVVAILKDEFGSLAPRTPERLLLEADACLLMDVAIIGVIHLTTHRLAFHASLVASDPEVRGFPQTLKTGSVTYHPSGWHSKRRIWLELDKHALIAYTSSKESDKARPLCTVLLSSIETIIPHDQKHPRILRIVRNCPKSHGHDYMEFDTDESAHIWRQELQGALFLHRHSTIADEDEEESDERRGVRISIPLTRINSVRHQIHPDLSKLVEIGISPEERDRVACPNMKSFKLGPVMPSAMWNRLEGIIYDAKFTAGECPDPTILEDQVFVDMGPLCSSGIHPDPSPEMTDTRAIAHALGIEPGTELWIAPARIYGTFTNHGYFVACENRVGFFSRNMTRRDVKYRLSGQQILDVAPYELSWAPLAAVSISIRATKDLRLVFRTQAIRDEAIRRTKVVMEHTVARRRSSIASSSDATSTSAPFSSSSRPSSVTSITSSRLSTDVLSPLSRTVNAAAAAAELMPQDVRNRLPKAINLPREPLLLNKHLHFVCLTIGSRGDVQPYIALGLGLLKEGHRVTIVTHEEYREWILGYDIDHRTAGGDPGVLMQLSVEDKIMSPEFFRRSMGKFRPWLDELLLEAWDACQTADVLIESPSAMAGVHIAEALKIPYFRAFSMPWTKTTEFPHPFLSPPVASPVFNSTSYILFSNVMWAATSGQVNRWRRNFLHLPNTDMGHLSQAKITFIYFFSQVVVPKPLDWPDTVTLSGYWFLKDSDPDWKPTPAFLDWMAQARADGKPVVYIGFGSVTVPRYRHVLSQVIEGVLQSGVRAILSTGWSQRMEKLKHQDPLVHIPPECIVVDKIPHDWLFASIDAALHHGGAGTTAASLRAGIPTLIKPWFGDQYFWASRVKALGVGLKVSDLKPSALAKALTRATTDTAMRAKAMEIGERIREEDGVHNAIYTIYTYLHRASQDRKSLDLKKF